MMCSYLVVNVVLFADHKSFKIPTMTVNYLIGSIKCVHWLPAISQLHHSSSFIMIELGNVKKLPIRHPIYLQ